MRAEPWTLGVSAENTAAPERLRILRAIEEHVPEITNRVLLSTCHRVELYGFGEPPVLDADLVLAQGEAAVAHLIRVAAGLESAVIGEDEVLHQVREALQNAHAAGGLDGRLHRLFELAIAAGRRARAGRTASGAGLADRAIGWLRRRAPLVGRPIVVAGAGRMGSALAHAASGAGAEVTIASRDAAKARRLAEVYGGQGVDLAEGAYQARGSAGLAIALGGIWEQLESMQAELPPVADISAPSAVPAAVRGRLNGGFLGIDDLLSGDRPLPRAYIQEAERIVAAKADEYLRWLDGRR